MTINQLRKQADKLLGKYSVRVSRIPTIEVYPIGKDYSAFYAQGEDAEWILNDCYNDKLHTHQSIILWLESAGILESEATV